VKLLAFNSVGRTAVVGATVERFDDDVVGTSDVRATATDGWTPGRLCASWGCSTPFCNIFRLTGRREWPIILSSLHLFIASPSLFCRWAKEEHSSCTKLPPKPALSVPSKTDRIRRSTGRQFRAARGKGCPAGTVSALDPHLAPPLGCARP
jgi:hypothetical protein